jgi:hypothetical protein
MSVATEPTDLEKLQWENAALRDALQYLVDTKDYKEEHGVDPIYIYRKIFGWMKARALLKNYKK